MNIKSLCNIMVFLTFMYAIFNVFYESKFIIQLIQSTSKVQSKLVSKIFLMQFMTLISKSMYLVTM